MDPIVLLKKFLLVSCIPILFVSCAEKKEIRVQDIEAGKNRNSIRDDQRMADLMRLAIQNSPKADSDYIIGPDDLLEINVFRTEDFNRTVRVSSQGNIALPLIGDIMAKGLTQAELQKEIALKLDRLVKDPFVSVTIKEYRAQKIGVIGAVQAPQIFVITGQKYLLDMLSMAGGLKEAGPVCYILRPPGSENEKGETIIIDLKQLLEKGDLSLNVPLYSGDVVNIPRNGVIFVDGAVRNPGVFPLESDTTLIKAIAMAGGLRDEADADEIMIYRNSGQDKREVITVDYGGINKGKIPDVRIAESDIVIVPRNGAKALAYGILNSIRGFFSFGNFSTGAGYK